MLPEGRVEHLEDLVPGVAARLVRRRLRHEGIHAGSVAEIAAAGEAHERALRDDFVLQRQQRSPIARELALAVPLQQPEVEGKERQSHRHERHGAHRKNDHGDGAIGHVVAHDVPELVREEKAPLVIAFEEFQRARRHHDEGILVADRVGVDLRRLRDIQLRAFRPVHRGKDVRQERIELRPLNRIHLHGVGKKYLADAALGEEGGYLAHDLIEAGYRAQGVERGAIGWVLPCPAGD